MNFKGQVLELAFHSGGRCSSQIVMDESLVFSDMFFISNVYLLENNFLDRKYINRVDYHYITGI